MLGAWIRERLLLLQGFSCNWINLWFGFALYTLRGGIYYIYAYMNITNLRGKYTTYILIYLWRNYKKILQFSTFRLYFRIRTGRPLSSSNFVKVVKVPNFPLNCVPNCNCRSQYWRNRLLPLQLLLRSKRRKEGRRTANSPADLLSGKQRRDVK